MSDVYIDKADKWFKDNLPDLLKSHRGEWVAIYDGKPLGFFATFALAYDEGVGKAGSEEVVVREITDKPDTPIETSVNFTLGLFDDASFTGL